MTKHTLLAFANHWQVVYCPVLKTIISLAPKYLLIGILWVFFSPKFLIAQPPVQFKSIKQKDGLSSDFAYSFLQDYQGFIWIGTEKGLNRYDGYQFTLFKADPETPGSLEGNFIWSLYEDRHQNLWVGTDQLNRLNRATGKFEQIRLEKDTLFYNDINVRSFCEDTYGNLWIGTVGSGLKRLVRREEKEGSTENTGWAIQHFVHEPNNPNSISSNHVVGVLADRNYLWITTNQGLDRLQIDNQQIEHIPLNYNFNDVLDVRFVSEFAKDQEDRVIYSTELTGIYRIEKTEQIPLTLDHEVSQKRIRAICSTEDKDGIWIGTDQGLYQFNYYNSETQAYHPNPQGIKSEPLEKIRALFLDKEQNLWIGTDGHGVKILKDQADFFQHYMHLPSDKMSLSHNQVRSMLIDGEGFLWVATLGGGLDKLQFDSLKGWKKIKNWRRNPTNPNSLPGNDIIQIIKSQSGKIWMALHRNGLAQLDPTTNQVKIFRNPSDSINLKNNWALHEDRKGNLWVGTFDGGFYYLDTRTGIFQNYSAAIAKSDYGIITNIYEDAEENLWLGTNNGLIKFDPVSGQFNHFFHDPADPQSISNNMVWAILEDKLAHLWIGTHLGLNRFDANTGKFQRFYEKDGLPSNIIYGLIKDKLDYLWISTDAGLTRYSEDFFRIFNQQGGLEDGAFLPHAYFQDHSNGQLFFGGLHGLNIIDPAKIQLDTIQPTMVLSTFSRYNQRNGYGETVLNPFIGDKKSLQLSYLDDILTFTFSDLNFQGFDKNNFEYQLLGLSDQWIPLEDNKKMTFIDLKPGAYVLNMRGQKPNGTLIKEKKLLEITVLPPWWASKWAYLLYFLILLSIIFVIYRFQLNRQLEKQESQRLKELDQFKSRLYTNITHEFRTPLTVILGMSEQLESELSNIPKKVKQKIDFIRRNGKNLLNLVNQLLDLSKVENDELKIHYIQGDIVRYVRYITESFHSLANFRNVLLKVESKETEIIMDYDTEKFRQILSNLLSNAIKYTPSGGRVTVDLQGLGNLEGLPYLEIKVKDTGSGIPSEDLPNIFDRFYQANDKIAKAGGTGIGLALTKELVRLLGGEIKVESELGKGTIFKVLLPIRRKASDTKHVISNEQLRDDVQRTTINQPVNQATVLLIEDNPDVVEYLISCLEKHYQLEFAYNGNAGINKALETIPDIIISDIMMPEKDGFEVCDTLKKDERTSHIPIVLLTAKADIENRLAGLSRGADAYLAKPFHQEELLIRLQKLLELRQKLQVYYRSFSTESPKHTDIQTPIHPPLEGTFIKKVREIIENKLEDVDFGIPQLCRAVGLSRSQLHKKLKALTGLSTTLYIRDIRLQKAKKLLKGSEMNVSEVAYAVGFKDPKYFSRLFIEQFGYPPSETR